MVWTMRYSRRVTTTRGRLDKRSAILEAAGKVFTRQGYELASVDAIAQLAGVAKPTVYNHFQDKETLFRTVMRDGAGRTAARIIAALDSIDDDADLAAELTRVAHLVIQCQLSDEGWALQRLLYAEAGRFADLYDDVVSQGGVPVVNALAGRLARLANRGQLAIDDVMTAASQFMALVAGDLPALSRLGTRPVPADELDRAVGAGVSTFLRAFAGARQV
jgi:TetR/AcrR family transcriptional repressor of mexJK operon